MTGRDPKVWEEADAWLREQQQPEEAGVAGLRLPMTFTFEGEDYDIIYRLMGRDELRAEFAATRGVALSTATVDQLAKTIISWNIEDQGQPYPPTRENLSALPLDFIYALRDALSEDMWRRWSSPEARKGDPE